MRHAHYVSDEAISTRRSESACGFVLSEWSYRRQCADCVVQPAQGNKCTVQTDTSGSIACRPHSLQLAKRVGWPDNAAARMRVERSMMSFGGRSNASEPRLGLPIRLVGERVRHWALAHRLHMSCNAVITLHSSSHRDVRQHCARVAGGQRALMETSPAPHSAERASSVGVNGSGWRAVTRQDRYFSTDASSRHPRQAHTHRHVHARRQLLSTIRNARSSRKANALLR
jgi:hypothetical protein